MDGRFDVTRAGVQYGVAELSQNGFMQDISFTGTAPDNNNVYRLAAVCGGRYVMLGVPVPDKSGRLTLVKSLSKTSCCELGFDSPGEFELVLPGENYVGQNDAQAEDAAGQKSDSEPENQPAAKAASPEPEVYIPMPSPPRENIQRHNMQNQNPWTRTQPRQSGKPAYTVKPDTPEKPVPLTKPDASEKPKPLMKPDVPEKPEPTVNPKPLEDKSGKWRPVANPSVMFAENGTLSSADEIKGALVSEEGEFVNLAIPISENEPFPLMSAFCLGEPQTISGGEYLVFKLKNGAFTA